MKVKKAVIPAAGLGTRVLPASKSTPKEMLGIVDKPAIQYIVEEAVSSGITDIIIVTSRGKTTVEDHFDRSPELEKILRIRGDVARLEQVIKVANLANIVYVRQKEALGLGDAVLCAKAFIGNEPFAVLYGDDVIKAKKPVCGQLCEVYSRFGLGVLGIKQLEKEQIVRCSSLELELLGDGVFKVIDMIEKPKFNEIMSQYSILGRCVLPPEIFSILEGIEPGVGGEIQLTDAMRVLAKKIGMIGFDYEGERFDMGSKLGILKANVEFALEHEELKYDFRKYIKDLAKEL